MNLKTNLIQENQKNNIEKNNKSVSGLVWEKKKINKSEVDDLKDKLNIDLTLAKLAVSRGISYDHFENFIDPKIKNLIPDPIILDDMQKATNKIIEFIKENRKIGILGDYDVDGSSATALFCNFFDDINVEYEYYIPDRLKEGYGPNIEAFQKLKDQNCNLILTLDCGTTSINSINYIHKKGVDVIVVDHHIEGEVLPNAYAIINPNKKSDSSKLNNLCATGVVFFLLISLNRELKKLKLVKDSCLPNLIKYLDLLALATICDLVKLDSINRAFVKQGIKVFNNYLNVGLKSLVEDCSIRKSINEYHMGFMLGPRINAGGRVGDSKMGTKLLISREKSLTSVISKKLCEYNDLRKSVERNVVIEAINQVNINNNDIICVHKENWHPGVLGIVASRLTEKFHRPSIVISENHEFCSASCRSVKSYDIGKLIMESVNKGLLISGGGHKMAGGFKINRSKISNFKESLKNKFTKSLEDLKKIFEFELSLSLINNQLYNQIEKFSPFGIGNPRPRFYLSDCFIKFPRIVGEKHYSFYLEDTYGSRIKAISFNSLGSKVGNVIESSGNIKGVIVTLQMNTWAGEDKTEVQIEDIIT